MTKAIINIRSVQGSVPEARYYKKDGTLRNPTKRERETDLIVSKQIEENRDEYRARLGNKLVYCADIKLPSMVIGETPHYCCVYAEDIEQLQNLSQALQGSDIAQERLEDTQRILKAYRAAWALLTQRQVDELLNGPNACHWDVRDAIDLDYKYRKNIWASRKPGDCAPKSKIIGEKAYGNLTSNTCSTAGFAYPQAYSVTANITPEGKVEMSELFPSEAFGVKVVKSLKDLGCTDKDIAKFRKSAKATGAAIKEGLIKAREDRIKSKK